ncbi:hypothetical protein Sango_1454000 [Sesamum angolense]|uniref:RING-CH-type domain-containing protein n=1 Tax=Sesamum angolense TaxID=2727404 RepID=A0AAE1WMQ5_9LAMI|nr:hypothetical protein Sango_1454000 [Sesamum angolense]
MATLEMSHIDLECGYRSSGGGRGSGVTSEVEEEEEGSVCFSDADDGSCHSQFYSTADGDGSYDDYSFACGSEILVDGAMESRRVSSVADPSDSLDLESGDKKGHSGSLDRDCRICHLSLVSSSPGSGIPIELGCSCKDDLAAAHKHCAETWFKIKGNKTCEICNSIARNVAGPIDIETVQQASESSAVVASTSSAPPPSTSENRTSNASGNTPSAFEREQIIGMMEKEMEYRVEMFNKLTHTCFKKCIENKRISEGILPCYTHCSDARHIPPQGYEYGDATPGVLSTRRDSCASFSIPSMKSETA